MKRSNSGFVIIYVIVLISLVGMYMVILSGGMKMYLIHTDQAELKAVERNLQLSGLAWIARHPAVSDDQPIELGTSTLSRRPAHLMISIHPQSDLSRLATIHTTCTFGNRTSRKIQTVCLRGS